MKKQPRQKKQSKIAKGLIKKKLAEEEKKKLIKYHESIDMLNKTTRTYVGKSDIHGVGLLALQDVKQGENLYTDIIYNALDLPYEYFKNIEWTKKHKLRPEVASLIIERFPLISTGSHFFYPDSRMSAFLNHSDNPNYDAVKDLALRDIKKDEEITQDYKLISNWQEIFGDWLK